MRDNFYEERLRYYMDREQAWTIRECEQAAQDDVDEQERYENYVD